MRIYLFGALTVLCGGALVQAQGWPGPAYYGYPQGYGPAAYNPGGWPAQGYYGYPQAYGSGYNIRGWPGSYGAYGYSPSASTYNYPYSASSGGSVLRTPAFAYPFGLSQNQGTTAMTSTMSATTPPADSPTKPESSSAVTGPPVAALPDLPAGTSVVEGATEPALPENSLAPGFRPHLWISADYVRSWLKPDHLTTPLATTGSPTDPSPGALGQPGTSDLFGDRIGLGGFNGIQGSVGMFLDEENRWAVEWRGLYILPHSSHDTAQSDADGNPVITRPFFNVVNQAQSAFADALPGFLAGGIAIDAKSEIFGSELNTHYNFYSSNCLRAGALIGFRYLHLDESLTIQDNVAPLVNNFLTFQGMPVGIGSSVWDQDRFQTTNNFFGGQIGGEMSWEGRWVVASGFAKVAIGGTTEHVNINGTTMLFSPEGNQVGGGGILALPSNMGQQNRTVFGIVPEFGLNVGVKVTPHVLLSAGYSFLLWNQVARPGRQIDPNLNPSMVPTDVSFGTVPGLLSPTATKISDELLWVHILNVGVQFQF